MESVNSYLWTALAGGFYTWVGLLFALEGSYSAYMAVFNGVITATNPRVRERNRKALFEMNKAIELAILKGTPMWFMVLIVSAAFILNFMLRLIAWPIYLYRSIAIRLGGQ